MKTPKVIPEAGYWQKESKPDTRSSYHALLEICIFVFSVISIVFSLGVITIGVLILNGL